MSPSFSEIRFVSKGSEAEREGGREGGREGAYRRSACVGPRLG